MTDIKDQRDKTRRSFVKKGLVLGALSASTIATSCFKQEGATETGEKKKLLTPDGEIVEVDSGYLKPIPESLCDDPTTDIRKGVPGKKFVMVIDLSRCNNLRKCHDACEKIHYLPPDKEWLKVLKMQDNDSTSPYWQPTNCFHCDRPPCVKVCPVDATFKRSDGIVFIDTKRCIGCRFCMVACPYGARSFNWIEPTISEEIFAQEHHSCESIIPRLGTVSKCDFCPDMAKNGDLPHCVTACPNGVYYFGDEKEDCVSNGSEVVRLTELLTEKSGYRYMEDLGLEPRVYYLPPVDRLFEFKDDEYSKHYET
ncbi:MAG: 4Fe-4S dicluster domain-containing protein [Saprospiraceae bacterium]|nr:4Fe-4S dicluster domain-containing protein [Saprospiraceae bacterium]